MKLLLGLVVAVVAGCGGEREDGGGIAIHTRADEAPSWAVPYGHEFWRPSHGVDVHDAISRVSHAFRGTEVHTLGYTARVDGSGLRVSLDGGGELDLRTARVMVDGHELYSGSGEVPRSVLGDTAQGLLAPGVIEHYQPRDEGVDVSWVISQRGAIVVEVSFEGLALDGSSHDVHFIDAAGKRVAKLGAAMLVDKGGHRWPVEPEVDGSVVRYRVGAEIVANAELPVALDPIVGPELTPDRPVIGSAPAVQSVPSVASNGSVSLVVWEDTRNDAIDIYATRVSSAGVVLDPSGIAVAVAPNEQRCPRAASNGTDFLVTWDDHRSEPNFGDLYVERITAAGVVLDPGGVAVVPLQYTNPVPGVASNGVDYLVAWEGNTSIYATRVSAAGVILDGAGFSLGQGSTVTGSPSVAWNGTDYFAVWEDVRNSQGGVYGTRVSSSGDVKDPQGIPVATGGIFDLPSVTSNGADYFVAWHDFGRSRVGAARVAATGVVLDPSGIDLGTGTAPSVASDGIDYVVTWLPGTTTPHHTVVASRVAASGAVIDTSPIIVNAQNNAALTAPAATFDGTRYLIAWASSNPADIQASRMDVDGTVADTTPVLVSTGPVTQFAPAVAATTSAILVAWSSDRVGQEDLYVARVSPAGIPLDPDGVVVVANGHDFTPALASNGTDFLVTWTDQSVAPGQIYAARITAAGDVGTPVAVGASTWPSAVASDGTDYLVVWFGLTSGSLQGARVLAGGTLGGTAFTISSVAFATTPAVAWGGGQYLVAWVGRPSSTVDIVATRLSATGQVLGSPTTVLAGATGDNPRPAVAASGSEYLVAWTDKRNLTSNDIYGARVSFGGVVLDSAGVPISTAPGDEGNAAVASNGTEYLVTWERSAATWDVTGARVATSGTVEDVGGFVIAADAPSGTPPRAAYSPASAAYVVVYQRYSLGHVHDRFVEVTGCGDGVVQVAESCDDGGMVDGDGCSAECASEPGYTCSGAPSTCTDIDECATNNGGCAETCTNTAGGFMCSCAPGYTLAANGRTCEDLNECATSNGGCAQVCTNTLGSFECSCAAGYVLASDGLGCDDFDECATNNGGCSQVCTNTPGSFACSCAAGYQFASDGVTCEDINECLTNNGDCTQVCMNMPGSHECACHPGYMLDADGVTCPDIDECADGTAGCDRNAACANTSGSYTCTCDDGYTGDGHTCDRIDAPGGCGCRTNDARGSWVLVLACVGVLRRRTRAGTRRAWFARAG